MKNFSINNHGLALHLKYRPFVLENFRNLINSKENPSEIHERVYELITQNLWLLDDKFLFFKKASATNIAHDIHCYFNGIIPGDVLIFGMESLQKNNVGQEVFLKMDHFFKKIIRYDKNQLASMLPNIEKLVDDENLLHKCRFFGNIVLSDHATENFIQNDLDDLWIKIPCLENSFTLADIKKFKYYDQNHQKHLVEIFVEILSYTDVYKKSLGKISQIL